jgi:hypothetical protein
MKARNTVEILVAMEKKWEEPENYSSLKNTCPQKGNLKTNDHPTSGLRVKVGKNESREEILTSSTQATLNESYYAKKLVALEDWQEKTSLPEGVWSSTLLLLQEEMTPLAFETWVKPCQIASLGESDVKLMTISNFSRNILTQQYGVIIQKALSSTLGRPVHLKVVVAMTTVKQPPLSSLQTNTTSSKKTWAAVQNPTQNPEVAILLERHEDMRGVILNSPIFKAPCDPVSQGGWGISIGAMINAGKQHTLERLIWAIRQTKDYRGANDRGKLFYHILRKGLEEKR